MNKLRLIFILAIFLVSLLPPEAQATNHLPPSSVVLPMQQQDDNPRIAQLGENRGQVPENGSEIWTYQGQVGDILTIKAEADKPANDTDAEERRQAGLLDMMLIVYAPDGTIIAKADDIQPGIVTDASIEGLQLPTDGTYKIEVLGLEKQGSGAYTLTLQAGSATPANPTPTSDPDWPTLTIENQLEDTICYVYIWPTSTDELGDEWLGTKKVILPYNEYQWGVTPDEYNIVLSDCYGNTLDRRGNFDVTKPSTLTVLHHALDYPEEQCYEALKLVRDGKPREALPLLEASFAARERAAFAGPDDEGICALGLGFLRNSFGNRSGALEAYQIALEIFQASSNRELEGTTANNIGGVYNRQGKYEQALEQYLQALQIRREVGDRTGEGRTLSGIGGIYHAQGKYEQALNYWEQAVEISREVGNRAGEGSTLGNIGGVYHAQGKYEQALESFQQAVEISHEVGDRAGEATSLNNIGLVYDSQGKYEEALAYYEQALEIKHEVGDRAGEGSTLGNIGALYHTQGKYKQALELHKKSLEIRHEVGDRAGEGTTLGNIGGTYHAQGKYKQALDQYQQALFIFREVGDRASEGSTLGNIGGVYHLQGKYEKALELFKQEFEINREVGNWAGEGATLNNIGLVYHVQGKYEQALAYYEQALEIRREVGDRAGEGQSLNNIAKIYENQTKYALALKQYLLALEIIREVGDRAGEGTVANNIGLIYNTQRRYEKALHHLQQSLDIRREVGDPAGEGQTLGSIGLVYNAQRRYEQALPYLQQSLEVRREVGDRAGEGITATNIGFAYQQQGQAEEALIHYELAMDVFEAVRATAGGEQERAGFIAQYAVLYNHAIGLYHEQGQEEDAFYTSERGRARSFLDSLATEYVQLSDDDLQELLAQERDAYDQRRMVRDRLARARAQNPPDAELVANLEAQLEDAEKAYSKAQEAINARGDELDALVPGRSGVLTLAEVQALLDDQTTLLSYWVLGDEGTLAFVIIIMPFRVRMMS